MSRLDERDERLLQRYVAGELSPQEAEELQRRLEEEQELREAYEAYATMEETFSRIRRTAPSLTEDEFLAALHERMDDEPAPASWFSGWRSFGVGVAVGAAVVALVFMVWPSQPSRDTVLHPLEPAPVVTARAPRVETPSPMSAPVPQEAVRYADHHEVQKAYEIEEISSPFPFTPYPVEDGEGYSILVVFISYEPDPAEAI